MSIAGWFIVICLVFAVLGLVIFFYTMSHPQKRRRTTTALTYNLDTHKYGLIFGLPVQDDDEDPDEDLDDMDELEE